MTTNKSPGLSGHTTRPGLQAGAFPESPKEKVKVTLTMNKIL